MRSTRTMLLFPAAAGVVVAACAGEVRDGGFAVRDSAGITIAESTAPAWADGGGWRVEAEPQMDIGTAGGDPRYEFSNIYDLMRLADGRIFVGDQGSVQVKVYSPTGEHIRDIGREGRGPGEFGQVGPMFPFRGDSIVVFDYQLQQMDVFDRDGEFGRVVPMRFGPDVIARILTSGGGRANYWLTGVVEDSLFFLTSPGENSVPLEIPGTYWDSTSFFIYEHPDSAIVDLGRFPLAERAGRRGPESPMLPFGGRMVLATTATGYYRGLNRTFAFDEYGWNGVLRRIVRTLVDPVPVTRDVIEAFEAQFVDQMMHGSGETVPESALRRLRQRLDEAVYPEYVPACDWLLVDPQGNVWAHHYRFRYDADQTWTVFDAEGRWLGPVEMPPGLQVSRFGPDWVLGVTRDSLDVEHVRVHRIFKS